MIQIRIIECNGEPPLDPAEADFDENGGSIGRAVKLNKLVLHDSDQHISRQHAFIYFRHNEYMLQNKGSVLPVYLNDQSLGHGQEAIISNGDVIEIGSYKLLVINKEIQTDKYNHKNNGKFQTGTDISTGENAIPPWPTDTKSIDTSGGNPLPEWIDSGNKKPQKPDTDIVVIEPQFPPSQIRDQDELLKALLSGLGVSDRDLSIEITPELMKLVGQLLRESIQCTIELLAVRTELKREIRADVTGIASKENNPLKFSPNVNVALTIFLKPTEDGYLAPIEAINDACNDLRAHQFGMFEGMKASISGLFRDFDPQKLEKRLTQKTILDTLLPMNRSAKLWSLFVERYAVLSEEVEEDFYNMFDREFLKAYSTKIAKLEREK